MVRRAATISILVYLAVSLFGCSWGQTTAPLMDAGSWTPNPPPTGGSPEAALGILNWSAGLSILGGMIALVLTRGRAGFAAVLGGCCLIILSYAISAYAHYVILPIGIVLTIVSALWGYLTLAKAWRTR